jgi:hypothetical protein
MVRTWRNGRGRVAAGVAAFGVVAGTVVMAAAPSEAIFPPLFGTTSTSPTRTTVPLETTTAPPPTTAPPSSTAPRPTTTQPPATSAPPPPPAAPAPAPPPPEDEESTAEPPCQRDAIDDFYTATKDVVLVVPYAAGLGINDILMCSGPGYTIDNLTDPPNGTVVKTPNDFGAFAYTPDPGFTGSDSFTYTLFQGSEVADQATAHITVTESCSVVAFSDIYYTAFETPVTEQAPGFLTNDNVECQPTTANISVDPANGTVTAGADGAFVYTPDPGFDDNDTFTYEIRDANQVVMATSVVTVVVDEPLCIAVDDAYSTTVDTPLNVGPPGVLANDVVCPAASSFEVDAQPIFGTVTLQSDGSFDYIPDQGFVGQDTFTYDHQKFDSNALDYVVLATAEVVIDVTATPVTTTTTTQPRRPRRPWRLARPRRPHLLATRPPREPIPRRRPHRVRARKRRHPRRPRPGSGSPHSTPR